MTQEPYHGSPEMIRELADESILPLTPGERLWKLFVFRPASGHATRLEHHIYTKQKTNGHLAMVTFAVHSPVPGQRARSAVARVPDLQPEALDQIVHAIREQTRVRPEEYEEIDLSDQGDLTEQMAYLREHIDVFDER